MIIAHKCNVNVMKRYTAVRLVLRDYTLIIAERSVTEKTRHSGTDRMGHRAFSLLGFNNSSPYNWPRRTHLFPRVSHGIGTVLYRSGLRLATITKYPRRVDRENNFPPPPPLPPVAPIIFQFRFADNFLIVHPHLPPSG